MKKIWFIFAVVVCFFCVSFFNADAAEYLIKETFFTNYSLKTTPFQLSGWSVNSAGGNAVSVNPLKIADSSDKLPVSMEKTFPKQENELLICETAFEMLSYIDGTKISVKSSDKLLFAVRCEQSQLVLDSGGVYSLNSSALGSITIRMNIDLKNSAVTIFVNGICAAANVPFASNLHSADRIVISTGEQGIGLMQISSVMIYKGYNINERFLPSATVTADYGWTKGSGGILRITPYGNFKGEDAYALKLMGNGTAPSISKSFYCDGIFTLRCMINFSDTANNGNMLTGAGVKFLSDGKRALAVYVKNGALYRKTDAEPEKLIMNKVIADFWYDFEIVVNQNSKTADIYVNMQQRDKDINIGAAVDKFEIVGFSEKDTAVFADDVMLFQKEPLPEDYVPVPQKLEKNDKPIIGIQSCSLWQEGKGLGWNYVSQTPYREPIIGYYDEGKPEVADWETKWLSEHGVDFQIYCWYRRGSGCAIKRPDYAGALHDGFLRSEYKSSMKFAIMFENNASGFADIEDFKTNIVPYWIEYYFTNPSYLIIDNKPVVSIYSASKFAEQAGGTKENLIEAVSFIKEACINAGFDGAYVLLQSSSDKKENFDLWAERGYDGVYAYNWGAESGYPEYQKQKIAAQLTAAPDMAIPTIAAGWNASPSGGILGRFLEPEEFSSLIEWTIEQMNNTVSESRLPILMLANLNEFGEGTFLYPTKKDGFAMLDSVLSALQKNAGEHTDAIPTENQCERVTRMYPQELPVILNSRVLKDNILPEVSGSVVYEWSGDSLGELCCGQYIDNLKLEDGILKMEITGNDPFLNINDAGIDCAEVDYIRMEVRNFTKACSGAVYFNTNKLNVINELKSYRFELKPESEEWQTCDIYVGSNPQWSGILNRLRIDPVSNAEGNYEIRKIQLMRSQNTLDLKIRFNKEIIAFSRKPIISGSEIYLPCSELFSALGAGVQTDMRTGEVTVVFGENVLIFRPGDNSFDQNGIKIELSDKLTVDNEILMIPLFKICETLNIETDKEGKEVNLRIPGEESHAAAGWEFNSNNCEGWKSNGTSKLYIVNTSGGFLRTLAMTKDAALSHDVNIPCNSANRISLRVRLRKGGSIKLYYTTDTQIEFSEDTMFEFDAEPSDNFVTYTVITDGNSAWNGTLTGIRLILDSDFSQLVDIDYIRLGYSQIGQIENINVCTDESKITASMDIILPSDSDEKQAKIIAAAFKDGKLIGLTTYNDVILSPGKNPRKVEIAAPAESVKIFVWSKTNDLMPYTEAKTIICR